MDHNHSDDNTIHPVLHNTTHDHDGDDVGRRITDINTTSPTTYWSWCTLTVLGTIAAGYFMAKCTY